MATRKKLQHTIENGHNVWTNVTCVWLYRCNIEEPTRIYCDRVVWDDDALSIYREVMLVGQINTEVDAYLVV